MKKNQTCSVLPGNNSTSIRYIDSLKPHDIYLILFLLSMILFSFTACGNSGGSSADGGTTPEGNPGVTVTPGTTTFSENGGTGSFSVVLASEPDGTVAIGIESPDIGKALLSSDEEERTLPGRSPVESLDLLFGPGDWSTAQTVIITGQDDDSADGNQSFSITVDVNAASTTDTTGYADLTPEQVADVSITVVDDDTPGITVTAPSILVTTEDEGQDSFTVVLNTMPDTDVVIDLVSSDTTEGTVSPSRLTFTPGNWSSVQTVTVTGVGDMLNDGDRTYTISTTLTSAGSQYSSFDPDDVSAVNVDTTPLLLATGRLGDLFLLNQITGEASPLLDIYTTVSGTNVGFMTSMVYHSANGTLYGGTGGSAPENGALYTINLSTGKATLLGSTGIYALPGMAVRESDGSIFTSYSTIFYRIDPDNVASPVILNDDVSYSTGAGMTYGPNGTLYVANGDGGDTITLYSRNDNTGAETTVGDLSYLNPDDFQDIDPQFPVYSRINCMTTRFDGQIFGLLVDEPYTYLVKVDKSGPEAELVGRTGNKLGGLVMIPADKRPPAFEPASPKGLQALAGNQCVLMGWSDSFTAESYNLYWSTSSGVTPSTGNLISDITSTFYSLPASPGTTIYCVVTAVNEIGESAPSTEASATSGTIGASGIAFNPASGPFDNDVTSALTGSGSVTDALDIGFTFTFFGTSYTQFKISSYCMITFDLAFGGGSSGFGKSIPLDDAYDNMIAIDWRRLDVAQGGTISWETRGSAPNRRLIVNFDRVATRYGYGTVTAQLILYETSNLIEIHTANLEKGATAAGDYYTQGVENATGSQAFYYPRRVADVFRLEDEAVRFNTNP